MTVSSILCAVFMAITPVSVHEKEPFKILSYNIRNAKGMDGQVNYERVAAVIRTANPAIAALQELDSVTKRSGGADVLKEIAVRTGMYYTYSAAIDYNGGKYGVGLLSKEKPVSVERITLPGREEKRTLLIVSFPAYVVFCSHFSLTEADQLSSAAIVNEQLKKINKPVYFLGDLNAVPTSAPIRALKEQWQLLSGESFTFPSDVPDRCIDYIFGARGKFNVAKTAVIDEPLASDHRPLFVTLK